jgi:Fic family protein
LLPSTHAADQAAADKFGSASQFNSFINKVAISDSQAITEANRNTIKVRLRELVNDGYLIKQGKGKGTLYLSGKVSP